MRPWAIAEDEVKVAASAGHVEVAFSLSKWPLAQVLAGTGAVALPAAVEVRIGPANTEKQHRQPDDLTTRRPRSSRCAGATPAALKHLRMPTVRALRRQRVGVQRRLHMPEERTAPVHPRRQPGLVELLAELLTDLPVRTEGGLVRVEALQQAAALDSAEQP